MKVVQYYPGDTEIKIGVIVGEEKGYNKVVFLNGPYQFQLMYIENRARYIHLRKADYTDLITNYLIKCSLPSASKLEEKGFVFADSDPDLKEFCALWIGTAKVVNDFEE